jgi:processive 1,2-diacylglycerol beta-glucosyltransferase
MEDSIEKDQLAIKFGEAENDKKLESKKIILAYASAGKGHETACKAIGEALKEKGFTGQIEIIDTLKFMPPFVASLFSQGYLYVAAKLPWLWFAMYESKSDLAELKPPPPYQDAFWKIILKRFGKYLKEQRPDYIISAYFTSSWAGGRYKLLHNPNCRVATVVTDYGVHPVWIAENQDRYFVATEEIKQEIAGLDWFTGAKKDKIEVTGIPIEKKFGVAMNKKELIKKYQLDPERFTVLLLTAVYGRHHIEMVVDQLLTCKRSVQILLVAYDGFDFSDKYKKALADKGIPYRIYGKIPFMQELMTMADIAITKTGGLTSTECLMCGCPMLIYKPYPGQEERNAALFLECGAAGRIYQLGSLAYKVDKLANSPQVHAGMVKAAQELTKYRAADIIAESVLRDLRGGK